MKKPTNKCPFRMPSFYDFLNELKHDSSFNVVDLTYDGMTDYGKPSGIDIDEDVYDEVLEKEVNRLGMSDDYQRAVKNVKLPQHIKDSDELGFLHGSYREGVSTLQDVCEKKKIYRTMRIDNIKAYKEELINQYDIGEILTLGEHWSAYPQSTTSMILESRKDNLFEAEIDPKDIDPMQSLVNMAVFPSENEVEFEDESLVLTKINGVSIIDGKGNSLKIPSRK